MHRLINLAIIIIMGLAGYALAIHFDSQKPPANATNTAIQAASNQTIITLKNQKAPDFSFTDINGQQYTLRDFKGKKIIINFWATWCAPCIHEFPQLLDIAEANPDDLILIALSSDINDEAIHKFLGKLEKQQDITWQAPNILIARDEKQRITQGQFQTYRLPETYIIDKEQNLHTKIIGANWTSEEFQRILKLIK